MCLLMLGILHLYEARLEGCDIGSPGMPKPRGVEGIWKVLMAIEARLVQMVIIRKGNLENPNDALYNDNIICANIICILFITFYEFSFMITSRMAFLFKLR
jgi:hypothetical protein